MDKRTVVVGSVTAVVTSRTNRTDMNITRYKRAMAAVFTPVDDVERNAEAEFIYVLARTESIVGALYGIPARGFAPDDVVAAYEGFLDETPELRLAVFGAINELDTPVDPVTAPPDALTEEQRKDPNSVAPAATTSVASGKSTRSSSRRRKRTNHLPTSDSTTPTT